LVARSLHSADDVNCHSVPHLFDTPNSFSRGGRSADWSGGRIGGGTLRGAAFENKPPQGPPETTPSLKQKHVIQLPLTFSGARRTPNAQTALRGTSRGPNSKAFQDKAISSDTGHFLLIAAHHYAATFPSLSRHLVRRASDRLQDCPHEKIDSKIIRGLCGQCGSVFVPGVSCRVRVRRIQSTKLKKRLNIQANVADVKAFTTSQQPMDKERVKNQLVYSCTCGEDSHFVGVTESLAVSNRRPDARASAGGEDRGHTSRSTAKKRKATALEKAVTQLSMAEAKRRSSPSFAVGAFVIDRFGES